MYQVLSWGMVSQVPGLDNGHRINPHPVVDDVVCPGCEAEQPTVTPALGDVVVDEVEDVALVRCEASERYGLSTGWWLACVV